MSGVELFTYADAHHVRVIRDTEGAPWFVLADLCRVLGIAATARLAARLDEGVRLTHTLQTAGGPQQMTVVSEPGMYEVVIRSDKPEAATFRRWITTEVLPTIRKTGSYGTLAIPQTYAEALRAAADQSDRAELAEAKIAELEPKAQVADKLLDAEGDLSVRDAAQALTRAGVKVGANRLFAELDRRGWIKRSHDGRYRVIQSAIETGYMSVLPQSHYHPKTGVLVLDPPQPRVTPKGIQRLLADYDKS
ncbi:MAG: phage antirepressor KilAC domain-containing protein [Mycobacterium sp.]